MYACCSVGAEGITLVADYVWIAHDDAGSDTTLFVSDGGIEFDYDNSAAAEFHSRPSTQPSPETYRIGLPALLSTSAAASSSGKPRVHSSSPCSARSALSGWGLSSD